MTEPSSEIRTPHVRFWDNYSKWFTLKRTVTDGPWEVVAREQEKK